MRVLNQVECAQVAGGFFDDAYAEHESDFSKALNEAKNMNIDAGTIPFNYQFDGSEDRPDGVTSDGKFPWWAANDSNVVLVDTNGKWGPDIAVVKVSNDSYRIETDVGSLELDVGESDPVSDFFNAIFGDARAAVDSLVERFGDTASEMARRDDLSNFNRDGVTEYYRNNEFVGYVDENNHNVVWLDRNSNGQYETLLRYYPNGEIWQDTNFDGSWDRRVR